MTLVELAPGVCSIGFFVGLTFGLLAGRSM